MGIGELVGMRWVTWSESDAAPQDLPPEVFESIMLLIERALAPGEDRQ